MLFLFSMLATFAASPMILTQYSLRTRSHANLVLATLLFFGHALVAGSFLLIMAITVAARVDSENVGAYWPWMMGAGALLSFFACAAFARTRMHVPDLAPNRWAFRAWIISMLGAAYLVATVADHLWFWRVPKANGIVASEIYDSVKIDCNFPYILVQEYGDSMVYRCPSFMLGSPFQQPFLPLASFSVGRSTLLKRELDRVLRNATDERRRLEIEMKD